MNATLTEMRHAYEAQEKALKEKMATVKGALLEHCKAHNVDSVRTGEGLFYRTVKRDYWTSDWDSMRKFIVEHKVPELLHERIHQTNMKQFLEEHPDLLPPGLNVDSEYTITVRRK
jgi:phage pi2 protein 07